MLTQERLKEALHYEPETGLFTRKEDAGGKYVGDIAGCKRNDGYIFISINDKQYRAHRLVFLYMTGEWPNHTDHINHIRHDNRWINLRNVTQAENNRNLLTSNKNTSGYTGVSFDRVNKKWEANIYTGGKKKRLGRFSSKDEAIKARKEANIKYGYSCGHGAVNA